MNKSVYNSTWLIDKIEKILPSIKLIVRIALSISTVAMLLSSVLILLFGKINDDTYYKHYAYIVWYAAMFGICTLIYSLPVLLSITLYKKLTRKDVWASIKKESILYPITVISAIILYITSNL